MFHCGIIEGNALQMIMVFAVKHFIKSDEREKGNKDRLAIGECFSNFAARPHFLVPGSTASLE